MSHPKPELTVVRLNEIQAEWMALDSNATEKEKRRVFDLMKKLPKSYISVSKNGLDAVAMVNGSPMNQRISLSEVRRYWGSVCNPTFAWQADKWIELPSIVKEVV